MWKKSIKLKFWLQLLAVLAIIIAFVLVLRQQSWVLQNLIFWIKNQGFLGVLVFVTVYNLATVLFVPATILTIAGGAIYGMVLGSIYVIFAAFFGATFAFLTGRFLLKNWLSLHWQNHPKFLAINAAITKNGFKIVFLTRLSPIFPFNLLNYIFGITTVSFRDYFLGSIGIIPGTLIYVYLGAAASDVAMDGQFLMIKSCFYVVSCLATVVITVYLARLAGKTLEQNFNQNI